MSSSRPWYDRPYRHPHSMPSPFSGVRSTRTPLGPHPGVNYDGSYSLDIYPDYDLPLPDDLTFAERRYLYSYRLRTLELTAAIQELETLDLSRTDLDDLIEEMRRHFDSDSEHVRHDAISRRQFNNPEPSDLR